MVIFKYLSTTKRNLQKQLEAGRDRVGLGCSTSYAHELQTEQPLTLDASPKGLAIRSGRARRRSQLPPRIEIRLIGLLLTADRSVLFDFHHVPARRAHNDRRPGFKLRERFPVDSQDTSPDCY